MCWKPIDHKMIFKSTKEKGESYVTVRVLVKIDVCNFVNAFHYKTADMMQFQSRLEPNQIR